jgi:hypothetical protein
MIAQSWAGAASSRRSRSATSTASWREWTLSFAEEVLDVAVDGGRGEKELLGDRLRRRAGGEQIDHLPLARRQAAAHRPPPAVGHLAHPLQDTHDRGAGDDRLPGGDLAHDVRQQPRVDVLRQVADGARTDRPDREVVIVARRQQDDPRVREIPSELPRELQAVGTR